MTGIILFRAQPFHNGHLSQIKRAYKEMESADGDLYVIVGSADKFGTKRNPIPIDVRLDLISNTLRDEYTDEELRRIKVVPLNDLSDEANNSYSWGEYLYEKLCHITGDKNFVFYYSDKPEIALSWFPGSIRDHIWFRFLSRSGNICATAVREHIMSLSDDAQESLKKELPFYVYGRISELHNYIARREDQ